MNRAVKIPCPTCPLCPFPQDKEDYHIRTNYRTVHLGFSKLLGTLSCGKICIFLLRIHYKKRSERDLFDDDNAMFSDFLYKGIIMLWVLICIALTSQCNSNENPQDMPL